MTNREAVIDHLGEPKGDRTAIGRADPLGNLTRSLRALQQTLTLDPLDLLVNAHYWYLLGCW